LAGAGLILTGNVLIFYEKGKLKINKYIWLGILATLLFRIVILIDIGISKQFNLPFYIMLTFFIPAIMNDFFICFLTGFASALAIFFSPRSKRDIFKKFMAVILIVLGASLTVLK